MPTKRQHFVPRCYLKAWETKVRTSMEPEKKFDGVYVFENGASKGEGRNIKSILWKSKLYTVKYDDYCNILGKYPEIDHDFITQIKDILNKTFTQPIHAICNSIAIANDHDILSNLKNLNDWEFFYADMNPAPKESVINLIKQTNSLCIEDGLDKVFENGWTDVCDRFISSVENEVENKKGVSYTIPKDIAETMIKSFYAMLCRNPEFDSFGLYTIVKNRILDPIGVDEQLSAQIMRIPWIKDLYHMIYGGSTDFYNIAVNQTFKNCQMILFRRYDDACTFITSDNPAFRHASMVEQKDSNGFFFPLTPDYLLMIAKGKDEIEKVDYRFADDAVVREFNRIIANNKTNLLISKQRYLPL